LDLNTGYDAIQKAKDFASKFSSKLQAVKKPANYTPKEEVKESDLRDSLDEDDFAKFNDRESPQKPKGKLTKKESSNSDSSLERADENDTNWLRESMQQSLKNWKNEVMEFDMGKKI
jgi:hypothetical protein